MLKYSSSGVFFATKRKETQNHDANT